jgi:hypothetical protein
MRRLLVAAMVIMMMMLGALPVAAADCTVIRVGGGCAAAVYQPATGVPLVTEAPSAPTTAVVLADEQFLGPPTPAPAHPPLLPLPRPARALPRSRFPRPADSLPLSGSMRR